MLAHTFCSFPKYGGPNIDPKYYNPYYKDTKMVPLILRNPHFKVLSVGIVELGYMLCGVDSNFSW